MSVPIMYRQNMDLSQFLCVNGRFSKIQSHIKMDLKS